MDGFICRVFLFFLFFFVSFCQAFLPHMLERRSGHIVTIASVLGLVAADRISDYVASKFAQVGLDESIKAHLYLKGKDDPVARKG